MKNILNMFIDIEDMTHGLCQEIDCSRCPANYNDVNCRDTLRLWIENKLKEQEGNNEHRRKNQST